MLSDEPISLNLSGFREPTPLAVLTLHGQKTFNHELNVSVVTYHDINQDGEIDVGRPIDASQLVSLFDSEDANPTWLEENVLVDHPTLKVWYRPAQKRPLHFRLDGEPLQFNVNHFPATLFIYCAKRKSVRLFALDSDARPTKHTSVYQLPVGNVNEQGVLCLGSGAAYLPQQVTVDNLHQVERTFFDAVSSHTSTSYLFVKDKEKQKRTAFSQVVNYWQQLAKRNGKAHVKRDFIPLGTIQRLL